VTGGYDVAVIGAGPAGLAAAATAALAGCRVVLLDAGPRAGGQYWRHSADTPPSDRTYRELAAEVRARVEHRTQAAVWFIEPGFALHTAAGVVHAQHLVFATGAYDRVVPFPGWDLPGVVTAGGAQALLKGQGVRVGRRVVVAGAGPFLLPVAAGLARAGIEVAGVFEAGNPLRYARHPLTAATKLGEGLRYAATLARYRVPFRTRHAVLAAHGRNEVESVTVGALDAAGFVRPGTSRTIECDALAVGYGFTPQLELPLALGCETIMDADNSLVLTVDGTQRTTVPSVYAAGEVTGVGGAALAVIEGRLAGAGVAASLGFAPPLPPRQLARLARRRVALRRFATLISKVHQPPADWADRLGDTLVCRCEEVPASRVREAIDLGATEARTVKLLARPGMGWCQGRVCGYATACLTAAGCDRSVNADDLAAFARRPFAQPVLLADLAADT
jgi:NADPH-dependent 2,4-dienoyl-CoA reductase/sulfur reductase-like enzyme